MAAAEIVEAAAKNDRRAFRFASVSSRENVAQQFAEHLAPLLVDVLATRSKTLDGAVLKLTGDSVRWVLRCLDSKSFWRVVGCARLPGGKWQRTPCDTKRCGTSPASLLWLNLNDLLFNTVFDCPACKIPLGCVPQKQGVRLTTHVTFQR